MFRLFFRLAPAPPFTSSICHLCQKTGPDCFRPQASAGATLASPRHRAHYQPGCRNPEVLPGNGLSAPQRGRSRWPALGVTPKHLNPRLLPAWSPFPSSLGERETISSLPGGSMAGRLMNASPEQRPACQNCVRCIQQSPRWAAGGTITGNKRHG